jgi:hypothetical protein
LNTQNKYDNRLGLELLGKDEHELLQDFRRLRGILRAWPVKDHSSTDLSWASILRSALEFSGATENFLRKYLDPEFTAPQNARLFSTFMEIDLLKPFGRFDVQKMRNALSKSKLFRTVDINAFEIGTYTIELMSFLPFGYIQYFVRCLKSHA